MELIACHRQSKVKLGAYAIAEHDWSAHFCAIDPLSLWWIRTHYPGTWANVKSRIGTLYPSQVSHGTYLSTNPKGKINSWVSCMLTAWTGIRTQAYVHMLTTTPWRHMHKLPKFHYEMRNMFIITWTTPTLKLCKLHLNSCLATLVMLPSKKQTV